MVYMNGRREEFMFLFLLVASFALVLLSQLILAGLLGFVEEEVALFE